MDDPQSQDRTSLHTPASMNEPSGAVQAHTQKDDRNLGIVLHELADSDVAKVQAFLRLGSNRLGHRWQVVGDGAAQLLLHGGGTSPTQAREQHGFATIVAVVDPGQAPGPDTATLLRPLQFEAFIDKLVEIECRLASGTDDSVPTAAAAAAATAVEVEVVDPPPPQDEPLADHDESLADGTRFRLRRWPPTALLKRHPHSLRVANFLSTQAISFTELLRLSHAEQEPCRAFVRDLLANGLLDIQPASVAPLSERIAPAGIPARVSGDVVEKIRRRLGLAQAL